MEQRKEFDFSFGASPKDADGARRLLQRTVEANQRTLNCVKAREVRSCAAAELFRNRYFALLRESALLEEEVRELNARHKGLTAALREVQRKNAGSPRHTCSVSETRTRASRTHDHSEGESVDARDAQRIQRLLNANQLRDELRDEVRRLQTTCEAALRERDALVRRVDAQRADFEPLVRDAGGVAKRAEAVRGALHACGDRSRAKEREREKEEKEEVLRVIVARSGEEERAFSTITALMSRWNSVEDDSVRAADCGRPQTVEEAVRFYQAWNDALMDTMSETLRECDGRREGLYARVEEMKKHTVT